MMSSSNKIFSIDFTYDSDYFTVAYATGFAVFTSSPIRNMYTKIFNGSTEWIAVGTIAGSSSASDEANDNRPMFGGATGNFHFVKAVLLHDTNMIGVIGNGTATVDPNPSRRDASVYEHFTQLFTKDRVVVWDAKTDSPLLVIDMNDLRTPAVHALTWFEDGLAALSAKRFQVDDGLEVDGDVGMVKRNSSGGSGGVGAVENPGGVAVVDDMVGEDCDWPDDVNPGVGEANVAAVDSTWHMTSHYWAPDQSHIVATGPPKATVDTEAGKDSKSKFRVRMMLTSANGFFYLIVGAPTATSERTLTIGRLGVINSLPTHLARSLTAPADQTPPSAAHRPVVRRCKLKVEYAHGRLGTHPDGVFLVVPSGNPGCFATEYVDDYTPPAQLLFEVHHRKAIGAFGVSSNLLQTIGSQHFKGSATVRINSTAAAAFLIASASTSANSIHLYLVIMAHLTYPAGKALGPTVKFNHGKIKEFRRAYLNDKVVLNSVAESDTVCDLHFSEDNRILVCCATSGTIKLYHIFGNQPTATGGRSASVDATASPAPSRTESVAENLEMQGTRSTSQDGSSPAGPVDDSWDTTTVTASDVASAAAAGVGSALWSSWEGLSRFVNNAQTMITSGAKALFAHEDPIADVNVDASFLRNPTESHTATAGITAHLSAPAPKNRENGQLFHERELVLLLSSGRALQYKIRLPQDCAGATKVDSPKIDGPSVHVLSTG